MADLIWSILPQDSDSRADLLYLLQVFGLQKTRSVLSNHPLSDLALIVPVEEVLAELDRRFAEIGVDLQDLNWERIRRALRAFVCCSLDSIDQTSCRKKTNRFALELRHWEPDVFAGRFPNVVQFLSADPHHAIDPEHHGSGYHIHYVRIIARQPMRTNVAFTFDPKEETGGTDTLYWYYHGRGAARVEAEHPTTFGKGRCRAIYGVCCRLLRRYAKDAFQPPSRDSGVLYPR